MKHLLVFSLAMIAPSFLVQPLPIADGIHIEKYKPIEIAYAERSTIDLLPERNLTVKQTFSAPTGDWVLQCKQWALEAGFELPESAINLIGKESKCSPTSQNPRSTAFGIGQFLSGTWAGVGCSKTSDPVQQLVCMKRYVDSRHGGWDGAWSYWVAHKSY